MTSSNWDMPLHLSVLKSEITRWDKYGTLTYRLGNIKCLCIPLPFRNVDICNSSKASWINLLLVSEHIWKHPMENILRSYCHNSIDSLAVSVKGPRSKVPLSLGLLFDTQGNPSFGLLGLPNLLIWSGDTTNASANSSDWTDGLVGLKFTWGQGMKRKL